MSVSNVDTAIEREKKKLEHNSEEFVTTNSCVLSVCSVRVRAAVHSNKESRSVDL